MVVTKKDKVKTATVSEALRLDSGRWIVRGSITAVSQVYHMVKAIKETCLCGTQTNKCTPPINYAQFKFIRWRTKDCPSCKERIKSTPIYIPAIGIEIRNPDSANNLEILKCILFAKNTKNVVVGQNVVVNGVIAVTETKDKGFSVLYVKSMKYEGKEEVKLSLEDTKQIYQFAESRNQSKQVVDDLLPMVIPSVIGHSKKKEGVLLSSVMTPEDKPRQKKRIHTLFLGPPGVAKTELLHGAADMVPGSTVQSGQGSTGLSLTAMVVKEEDTTMLRIGPIPNARGKICCINEINKQNYGDQDKILDFMQVGQSIINKFGMNAQIRGPATIIASANPVHGDFTHLENGKVDVNEVTIMSALRDRFDLIFIFNSETDHTKLLQYADSKGRLLNQEQVPICSPFLVKYIMFAKTFNPKISEEAMSILNKCYADFASNGSISPRRLETLYNLAIARAKLKLKETVDKEDAIETVEYYNKVVEDYHAATVVASDPRDVAASKILELLEEYSKNPIQSGPVAFTDLVVIAT